ncbi:ATP-binding cassette domain-containing protein [Rhodobacterales bacterium HKCCE2091]|nr:ATP-binding cassette domain-containing protein [Rhodobacterales bacterium HKCCE2091]
MIDAFAPAEGPPPAALWPFIRWCLSGAWGVIIVASVISALAGSLEVVTAWLLGLIVDSVSGAEDRAGYLADNWPLLAVFIAFFLVARPLAFGSSAALNGITLPTNIYPLIQSRLHRWTLGHAITFFDNDFAGRIAQKQAQTANALTLTVNETINAVVFAVSSLIGSVLLLGAIDWRVAALLAVWLVLYFWMIGWFLPRIRKRSAARAGARAMVTGQVVDTITNVKTVKLFGHTEHEDRAAISALGTFRDRVLEFGALSTGFRFALMTVAGLLPAGLILATILLWRQGVATPGDIAATGAVSMRIAQMTGWVSFTLMGIYSYIGEVEDGMRTLTPRHELTDAEGARPLGPISGRIAFEDVSFAYGQESGGVDGIDLVVEPGEKLGLVGASGAGKSTLAALLMRLYDPEQGRITLDGTDIREVTQDSLRQQIAMVTQETAMFNRSARDNILYGRPDATEDEMVAAAKRAEADDFIRDLADHKGRTGYEAYLGERGVKLSGGQRQRIALARAFLKDAPVLVLDEATSALDSEVEASIQAALSQVMEGKTVIAIAHRLSTIAAMDRILVMDRGRIVEQGTHQELLDSGGLYARYWNRQSGGFIGLDQAAAE